MSSSSEGSEPSFLIPFEVGLDDASAERFAFFAISNRSSISFRVEDEEASDGVFWDEGLDLRGFTSDLTPVTTIDFDVDFFSKFEFDVGFSTIDFDVDFFSKFDLDVDC